VAILGVRGEAGCRGAGMLPRMAYDEDYAASIALTCPLGEP
jgi:hypothetical protein